MLTTIERDALDAEVQQLRARQEARGNRLASLNLEMAVLRKRHEEIQVEIDNNRSELARDRESTISLDLREERSIARGKRIDSIDAELEVLGARHEQIRIELETDGDEQLRDEQRHDEIYAVLALHYSDKIAESDRKIIELERKLGLKPKHIPNLPS